MIIRESYRFIKHINELRESYPSIEDDVQNLKNELPTIAYKVITKLNIPLREILFKDGTKILPWRIRLNNSDLNKGKRHGYRVFYCKNGNGETVLLGIFMKPKLEDGQYDIIAKELILSAQEEKII